MSAAEAPALVPAGRAPAAVLASAPVTALVLTLLAASSLEEGAKAVARQSDDAVGLLERAKTEGPYGYADHVRVYELLGIAYAYAERRAEALKAFDLMLALEPSHALSYKLSPKATFVFEEARKAAAARPAPGLDVQWARDVGAAAAFPIDVSIVADPFAFLSRARVYWRLKGGGAWQSDDVALDATRAARVTLPAVAGAEQDVERELRIVGLDPHGNEVLRWGTEQFPRLLLARHQPKSRLGPALGIAGAALVVAIVVTSIVAVYATKPLPDAAPATFGWR